MLYINNKEKLERIKLEKDNFYVVADFDQTLTEGTSGGTWGMLAKSGIGDKGYEIKRKELYNKYRPIETDASIPEEEKIKYMEEWWKQHIHLFYEYSLKEEIIKNAIKKAGLKYREGAEDFLSGLNNNNIPVIIISAGIGNIIKEFLKETNTSYGNVKIISNFIKFTNGIIDTFEGDIIHSFNKNIVSVPENVKDNRKNILLLGDVIGDLKMVTEDKLDDTITVGFLDEKIEENLEYYNKAFDIVLTDNGTFYELNRILNI